MKSFKRITITFDTDPLDMGVQIRDADGEQVGSILYYAETDQHRFHNWLNEAAPTESCRATRKWAMADARRIFGSPRGQKMLHEERVFRTLREAGFAIRDAREVARKAGKTARERATA